MNKLLALSALIVTVAFIARPAAAQSTNAYHQSNLTANSPGAANNTDPQLSNPWGISFTPGGPFWVADNNSGLSTVYFADGTKTTPTVTIPSAQTNPCSPGCPSGTVANLSANPNDFGGNVFLFDTEDGTLSAWANGNSATKVVDNSGSGAVYKGLAMISNSAGSFLLAANFNSGHVDVFDTTFKAATLAGSFTDPNLPAGFAPHGIHVVNGKVFVAYAMQDSPKHDPVIGAGNGIVDTFDMNGNFLQRFASQGTLNAPWGVVQTPASFGAFGNDILVGNFGDGVINAFDQTGNPLGQLKDVSGNLITNPGLWDLVFGQNGTGDPNTLYLTAGGADQMHGLFASLVPTQAVAGGDFSFSASQSALSVSIGQSASTTVSVTGLNGFNSSVNLSCSGPAGITCSISPATVTVGTTPATATVTVAVPSGYSIAALESQKPWLALAFPLAGIAGVLAFRLPRLRAKNAKMFGSAGLLVIAFACILFVSGCGGGGNNAMNNSGNPASGSQTITVTAQAGSIMHSANLTLTVH
jgi:uncharacterized protein (TIGR03118 family)